MDFDEKAYAAALEKWYAERQELKLARVPKVGEIWEADYIALFGRPEKLVRVEVVEVRPKAGTHNEWWGISWKGCESGIVNSEIGRIFKGMFNPEDGYNLPKPQVEDFEIKGVPEKPHNEMQSIVDFMERDVYDEGDLY